MTALEVNGVAESVTVLITPYLPLIGTLVGAGVVGIFAIWNRRRGAVETRAPDVDEIWRQQAYESRELDIERRIRRMLEDMYRDLRRVFRGYVARVAQGGDPNLSSREQNILDREVPDRAQFEPPE